MAISSRRSSTPRTPRADLNDQRRSLPNYFKQYKKRPIELDMNASIYACIFYHRSYQRIFRYHWELTSFFVKGGIPPSQGTHFFSIRLMAAPPSVSSKPLPWLKDFSQRSPGLRWRPPSRHGSGSPSSPCRSVVRQP